MRLKPQIYNSVADRFLEGLGTKSRRAIAVGGLSLFLGAVAWGAEIQFTTLPEVVRTTVIRQTGIPGPDKVVQVVQEPDNIYEITVLTDTGQRIIYVTEDGTIVQRPGVAVDEGSTSGSEEVTLTLDEIQRGGNRYRFVEDQGPNKVYMDTQTNKRVIVKNQTTDVEQNRGSVRGQEGTNGQNGTHERNQISGQRNEENMREQNGTTRNPGSDQGNMRRDENNQNRGAGQGTVNKPQTPSAEPNGNNRNMQNKEGSNSKMGTEEQTGANRNTKGQMSPNERASENRGTTNQQEQKGSQRGQGKEKASPTP
jgi:hypothetical protein